MAMERGLKIDLAEFSRSLIVEKFLGWVYMIKEILEFKEVLKDKKVLLVAPWQHGYMVGPLNGGTN